MTIIQHLESFTDLVVTEGTIYPILSRLTREGVLQSKWVDNEAPHARKYLSGGAFLVIAALKPIFPDTVGF